MGKTTSEDASVFRITARSGVDISGTFTKEVTALYHTYDNGFVVFKDLGHAAVYAITAGDVLEIERLRGHVILAIAREELELILSGLRERADHLGAAVPADEVTARELRQVSALTESLERLRPIAKVREAEDQPSLPRVAPLCMCTRDTGRGVTSINPECELHVVTWGGITVSGAVAG